MGGYGWEVCEACPSVLFMLCDPGVVRCVTGFSDSLAQESQSGLLNRVARGRRDDQGVKC